MSKATFSTSLFGVSGNPEESDLYKCVHCGFCLQACPTYLETGLETESPRGRLALMKAVNEGRIGATRRVISHWDLCIQCRACESACPSGVPYGSLIEATMSHVSRRRKSRYFSGFIQKVLTRNILPNQKILSLIVGLLWLYQQSGLWWFVRTTKLLRLFSKNLADLNESSPQVPARKFKAQGQVYSPLGTPRARVALLSGCVMPLIHGPEMDAVVRVLTHNDCEVVVPSKQVCCGALNTHVGDLETAKGLARNNIDTFLEESVDFVVVASAGCGVRMKEYHELLRNDENYHEKAKQFGKVVKDVHEFLVDLPFYPPKGKLDYRLTYQDSCHLAHAQKITEAPRLLLKSIPGIDFVEMSDASRCCGGGGSYTLTERDFSVRVLDTKMDNIVDTDVQVIATANPGCVMQLQQGIKRRNLSARVRYVTDILDESYQTQDFS